MWVKTISLTVILGICAECELKSVITEEQIENMRGAFDSYNVHRIFRATSNFSENERNIFAGIPVLLHHNFKDIDGLECPADTPSGIAAFEPRDFHINGFNAIFKGSALTDHSDEPFVDTLALVGSLGTVGQTEKSDFDYVVMVNKERANDRQLINLSLKLTFIEKLMMEKFSVEVHFFIQDIGDFRNNRFGKTDKETIGTAMGKLFKDEFYRATIIVAGKRPLWWIIPPGMPEEDEGKFRELLETFPGFTWDGYLDLGHILNPDPDEFFGGALWQMNKSISSPFKSVLKMGLMEAYLFDREKGLLCEEIKRELLQSPDMHNKIDPYLKMFEWIVDFYAKRNMDREVRLLRIAFLLKLGISAERAADLLTLSMTRFTERERHIAEAIRQWNITPSELREMQEDCTCAEGCYQELGEVNRFFLDVYVRLSDWLKSSGISNRRITDRDMTVLGRKLFTHFQRRKGKIPYIYPGNAPDTPPASLTLTNDKFTAGENTWRLFEEYDGGSPSYENPSLPIAGFNTIIEILTWMVINRIWKPGSRIHFSSQAAGYTKTDIEHILKELYDFFIGSGKPGSSREDYLLDNVIVMAFAVPNFGLHLSPREIERVDMVMLNSWDEYIFARKPAKKAYEDTVNMMKTAKTSGKPFRLGVAAPPSQNDPRLVQEFKFAVDKIDTEVFGRRKSKKTRLDLP